MGEEEEEEEGGIFEAKLTESGRGGEPLKKCCGNPSPTIWRRRSEKDDDL